MSTVIKCTCGWSEPHAAWHGAWHGVGIVWRRMWLHVCVYILHRGHTPTMSYYHMRPHYHHIITSHHIT